MGHTLENGADLEKDLWDKRMSLLQTAGTQTNTGWMQEISDYNHLHITLIN